MKLAALIQPSIHLQIESLYQAFLELNAVEQTTLMILAVVYKPIGINKLAHVIDILDSRGFLPQPKKEYRLNGAAKRAIDSTVVY